MFIEEVGLKNYQSHEDTVVRFAESDNAVVGPSSGGKTAIKRAIECVFFNRYSTADYVREGADKFSVYVKLSSGDIITRERGVKRGNKYIITYRDGRVLELSSFGKNVPEEVMELHGLELQTIGKRKNDSINCAQQLDGPFFLQETPQDRAAIIGSIAKTQLTDKAVALTLEQNNIYKAELKNNKKDEKVIKEKLESLSFIETAKTLMAELKDNFKYLQDTKDKYDRSKEKLDYIEYQEIEKAKQRVIIQAYHDCEYVLDKINLLSEMVNKYYMATNDLRQIEEYYREIDYAKHVIACFSNVEEVEKNVTNMDEDLKRYNWAKKFLEEKHNFEIDRINKERVIHALGEIDVLESELSLMESKLKLHSNASKAYKELEELYKRKENGLKMMTDVNKDLDNKINEYSDLLQQSGKCPICFSEIDAGALNHIHEELQ